MEYELHFYYNDSEIFSFPCRVIPDCSQHLIRPDHSIWKVLRTYQIPTTNIVQVLVEPETVH